MKSLRKIVLIFFVMVAWIRAAEKPPFVHAPMGVANGCFVETVALLDAWQEKAGADVWAKLLRWGAKEAEEVVAGHAVAVGESNGRLWCWDINAGWKPLAVDATQRENADAVAGPAAARYTKVKVQYPLYMADFPQTPATAPVAQLAATNLAIRDASIVGERLAKRRPVNVVIFQQGSGDAARDNAAAVFVFGGRYCVYVPEYGTVPFRTQGGVENLRLIQQALRRMVGDVGIVRKL